MPLNYKLVETAMDYVRKKALVAGENVVAWPKYEKPAASKKSFWKFW